MNDHGESAPPAKLPQVTVATEVMQLLAPRSQIPLDGDLT